MQTVLTYDEYIASQTINRQPNTIPVYLEIPINQIQPMALDFDVQLQKVQKIKKLIHEYEDALTYERKKMKIEQDILQELCNERGHAYVAEDNGDYHRPGYYYTCKCCGFFTTYRPVNFTIQRTT